MLFHQEAGGILSSEETGKKVKEEEKREGKKRKNGLEGDENESRARKELMKMHTAFLSELNSKREQNSRLRPTELNPKSLLHCHFSSTNLNSLKKQIPSKAPMPCWENEWQMYFKRIFARLTQVTAQAIILETFSAAGMETWLLLLMLVPMEF